RFARPGHADVLRRRACLVIGLMRQTGDLTIHDRWLYVLVTRRVGGRLLLTLGSPLGLETIVYERLVPQPPVYPPLVGRWAHVAALDDHLAADPNLAPKFSPTPVRRLESMLVRNTSPHAAVDYLATPEAGRPIGEILGVSGRA